MPRARCLPSAPVSTPWKAASRPAWRCAGGQGWKRPHIMMLADDPGCTLIEPIGEKKEQLRKVYEGDLMLNGGHIAGWAVEDPALLAQIDSALNALGSQEAFDARYPQAKGGAPLTLAVGDGNHSLASAKACWEELKKTLTPEQQLTHPARWCLAEVCNVHSPAIEIEPIHRAFSMWTAVPCCWPSSRGAIPTRQASASAMQNSSPLRWQAPMWPMCSALNIPLPR